MLHETVLTMASPGTKRERAMNRVREIRQEVTLQFLTAFKFPFAIRTRRSFLVGGRFSLDGRDYL
jgi:hypothetical protein